MGSHFRRDPCLVEWLLWLGGGGCRDADRVALALNPKIMNTRSRSGLIALAGQTFHSFLVVMVLALIAQIPDDSR